MAAILLVAGMSLAQPTAADHQMPVLAQGSVPGSGWASFKIETNGAPYIISVGGSTIGTKAFWGIEEFDSHHNHFYSAFATYLGDADGVLVDAYAAPVDQRVDVQTPDPRGGDRFLTLAYNTGVTGKAPGLFRYMAWLAGDQSTMHYVVRGEPGSVLLGIETGTEAYLFDDADIRGPLGLQAYRGDQGARADVFGSVHYEAQDRLYGYFGVVRDDVLCLQASLATSCTDPLGGEQLTAREPWWSRPCNAGCTLAGAVHGNYTFQHTGTDATVLPHDVANCGNTVCAVTTQGRDRVVLSFVDGLLPE